MRRADERAQAARSVQCPCRAWPGVPCGPSGDHLARYLRAEQDDAITRESLKEVIAGLDVIAPQYDMLIGSGAFKSIDPPEGADNQAILLAKLGRE